jgi:hypothetical protein
VHRDKVSRAQKLWRFRKFSEDMASVALQSAIKLTNDAVGERKRASERVEAATRWKGVVDDDAHLRLEVYELALEMEDVAMSAERDAKDRERSLEEKQDEATGRYCEAMNASKIVDRRRKQLTGEHEARRERSEGDAVSDLQLSRSIRTDD